MREFTFKVNRMDKKWISIDGHCQMNCMNQTISCYSCEQFDDCNCKLMTSIEQQKRKPMEMLLKFKKLTDVRPDGSKIIVLFQDNDRKCLQTMYPNQGDYTFANEDKLWWSYYPDKIESNTDCTDCNNLKDHIIGLIYSCSNCEIIMKYLDYTKMRCAKHL